MSNCYVLTNSPFFANPPALLSLNHASLSSQAATTAPVPQAPNSTNTAAATLTTFVTRAATPPLPATPLLANADTGTTGHYMSLRDVSCLLNIAISPSPIRVSLPDGSFAVSTHIGTLNLLKSLPASARHVDIFPDWLGPLISIGVLCDHGLTAVFTATTVTLLDSAGTVALSGTRSPITKIWTVNLNASESSPAPPHRPVAATVITEAKGTQAQIVAFYHAAMGSPSLSTLECALHAAYVTLPGLSTAMLRKFPPSSPATSKGHLDQVRQGMRSTARLSDDDPLFDSPSDLHPQPVPRNSSRSTVTVKVVPFTEMRSTDLTGRFPVQSKSGAQYVMVMLSCNYIHVEPMNTRQGPDYVRAYSRGSEFFKSHGITPLYERLDNETSTALERYCASQLPPIQIQFVPPHNHRANAAERTIRTWKNHFIAMLATADPDFPLDAWDLLLPQSELTINLLRSSSHCAHVSAWQSIRGAYVFDHEPIAPAGMKIVCFESPTQRATWSPHGVDGFYVGPAHRHHRCYTVYIPSTGGTRVTGQLTWHPPPLYTLPCASPLADVISCLSRLRQSIDTLNSHHPATRHLPSPTSHLVPDLTRALDAISACFPSLPPPDSTELPPPQESSPSSHITVVAPDFPALPQRVLENPPTTVTPTSSPATSPRPPAPASTILPCLSTAPSPPPSISTVLSPDLNLHNPDDISAPPIPNLALLETPALQGLQPPRRSNRRRDATYSRHTAHLLAASVQMSDAFALDDANRPLTYRATRHSPDLALWQAAESEELHRLLETTKTMTWMDPADKPKHRTASYYNPQVKVKVKDGVLHRRVRGTYGGNVSDYSGIRSSWTADMQTVKLLLNAVVSENAEFCTADIGDFYLGSDLEHDEFMYLTRSQVPADIQARYLSTIIWLGDKTLVRISKGIYGLPQAGRLANQKLVQLLSAHGYHQTQTPCLFKHDTLDVFFTLVVDDFAIKYKHTADVEHLFSVIRKEYRLETDMSGSKYIGITIQYDRKARTISLSMPGYVEAALKRFNVIRADKPTHCPLVFEPIVYGQKQQLTSIDDSPPVSAATGTFIREVIGVFLYYGRAIDPNMLTPLGKLASRQAHPTVALHDAVLHFLQYAATYPNAQLEYHPSDMRLILSSDASYLSEPCSRSRAGGIHFLSSLGPASTAPLNGAIDIVSSIIPTVVSAASEAELAALFLNGQAAMPTRQTLQDLGYPQSATPIFTDNTTALGIASSTVRLKRSKAIDMRYFWIRDRVTLGDYSVTWGPGCENLGDYFTKTHPTSHYRAMRPTFVRDPTL